MECSICIEEITKQTGCVTLSCEHNFHFRCIDSWFTKQIFDDLPQTCPCCRSAGTELDRCSVAEANDDDDASYEEEDGVSEAGSLDEFAERIWDGTLRLERNSSGQWVLIDMEEVAYDSLRSVFGPLNDLDEEAPMLPAPALLRFPEGDPRRRVVYHWEQDAGVIVDLPPNYVEELEQQETAQQEAARKIQAFFRGNQVRNTHNAAVALMRLFQQAYNL